MAASNKDTIYIDIDDEITGIIDKLRASNGKIVALVLPKRASVFQSIVNMKLLKRAADDSKKNLVLITSEAGLLPLAGAAGVHVAKTLTSKPEIPTGPLGNDEAEETIDETPDFDDDQEITTETAGDKPIGELAGVGAATTAAGDMETLELDNDEAPEDAAAAAGVSKTFEPPKGKKDKKLSIPNFERFRLLLILGGLGLILLIIGFIFAASALPKATISIKTDATNVPVGADLKLSTTAKTLHTTDNTIPAKLVQQQKTYTQQVPTTGQKNNGNKATGTVTVTNCSDSDTSVAAGTGFSSGSNTYISTEDATVPPSDFFSNGKCKNNGKATINVIAQNGGSSYNLPSGAPFTVAGHASLSGQGGTISGGTDNNVQVVSQGDINTAKSKINTNDSGVKQSLQNSLKQDNYFAITATFSAGTPTTTSSAAVGEAANSVTVTEAVTYTMFGVRESDLKTVVDNAVKDQIDTQKQSILSEGLDSASFTVNNQTATDAQVSLQTNVEAGPELNVEDIKQAAAGKKPGAVKSELQSNPDVTDVEVKLSPFWVGSVPKKTSRITVTVAKPATTSKANANNP
jgi:hypothetical protein